MSKLRVKKAVLNRARRIAKRGRPTPPAPAPSFPLVRLWYPTHGTGPESERLVKVTKMTDNQIKGFQLESVIDEGPGEPRTFNLNKVWRTIEFIGLKS